MSVTAPFRRLLLPTLTVVLVAGLAGACGGRRAALPPGTEQEADRFLFARGSEALENRSWVNAREYFRQLVETYPTSPFRQDAKLGIGDSYLGERRVESDILAAGEFREFLRFYPLSERADYAQYRLALSQTRQMLAPQRDQTPTRDALRELQTFITNYPTSRYLPEVLALERETRDRLSESEFLVGRHYYRVRWYLGAVSRLENLLKADPQYTRRDGAYFYLAAAYERQSRPDDARAYYQKLVEEFAVSEYLNDARKRLQELEAGGPAGPMADTPSQPSSSATATR